MYVISIDIQHTIGHHSFPNIIGRDPDLYHVPDTIRNSADVELAPMHRYQNYLFLATATFGIPMYFLVGGSLLCMLGTPYNGVVPLSYTWSLNTISVPIRLLFFMIFMYILPILFHGLSFKAAAFAIVPEFIFTACFTICTQVNHLVPEATEKFSSNFFIHQIITGHNINTGGYWTTLFTGGLNMQIEHHLFPSVNHCHLHKLVPHVKALCSRYNIAYPESESLWEALTKHVQHLYIKGPGAFEHSIEQDGNKTTKRD
jgi:fatty acid desaturase